MTNILSTKYTTVEIFTTEDGIEIKSSYYVSRSNREHRKDLTKAFALDTEIHPLQTTLLDFPV
jgi:hypothetical protein